MEKIIALALLLIISTPLLARIPTTSDCIDHTYYSGKLSQDGHQYWELDVYRGGIRHCYIANPTDEPICSPWKA